MRLLITVILTIGTLWSFDFTSDSFESREIARVPYYPRGYITCGDADHDGLHELYAKKPYPYHTGCILEFTREMEYDSTEIGVVWPAYYFVSDIDRDGKSELWARHAALTTCTLYVIESRDSTSMPLHMVWVKPNFHIDFIVNAGDYDEDSIPELLLHDHNNGHIFIYECAGDDSFVPKRQLPESLFSYSGFNLCPDIDQDGKPEIFAGWHDTHFVVVLELVRDDSFRIVKFYQVPLLSYAIIYAVAGAHDIDQDGKNEALIMGVDRQGTGILAVFESPCNDSFEIVWHTYFPADFFSEHTISFGDVNGDGTPEVALTDGAYVRLFRCTGNDNYEQFWHVYTGQIGVGLYDLNNDGKAEVICATDNDQTVIYEYFSLGLAELQLRQLEQVNISPSVVARGKQVMLDRMPENAKMQILDVSGRVIAEPERLWNTRAVSPVAYFIRITKGNQSITRKILVVE